MEAETRTCQICRNNFTIQPEDFVFYKKFKVPPPTFCPECRLIRRLAFRNERALYKRKCDLCGDMRIMMYAPDVPFPVYCYDCWWSDRWDAKSYGRDYDFSRPFFEQFHELMLRVPRPGVIKQGESVGSEYTNRVTDMRHCYLLYGTAVAEYCRYGVWLNGSKECVDGYNVQKSERCYECIDCIQGYQLAFSQESNSCADSWFLFNCNNCQNCFGCVNLRNKKYCIFNEQYSKEEYEKRIKEMQVWTLEGWRRAAEQFEALKKKHIVPALVTHHAVNKSGNWIDDSKNVHYGFGLYNVEDGRYLYDVFRASQVMDYSFWGANSELMYEVVNSGIQCAHVRFAHESWNQVIDAEYIMNCHSSKNLFGCVGIRKGEYVIFNKAYSKQDFEKLRGEIIAQMHSMPFRDKAGREYRYGEFFPIEHSPHAYNESNAQEFFPLEEQEALSKHYPWRSPVERMPQITLKSENLPNEAKDASDSIINDVVGCAHEGICVHQCTKAFRILAEDLAMYKRAFLPLPRLCPNCRHSERLAKRNPLKLWKRNCQCKGAESSSYQNTAIHFHGSGSCPNEFETSYAPERPETRPTERSQSFGQVVYCEQCYTAEVA